MADIPPVALERLARLRRLYEMARAAADGLHQPVEDARRQVEHAQFGLTMATHADGAGVVVGETDGLSFVRVGRERTVRGVGGAAAYVVETTSELRREPKYDAVTRPVFEAKARLAEVRDQRREALERAQELRRGAEAIEAALRARGWREHAPKGEGLLGGPPGPIVVDAAVPAPFNMFRMARGAR